MGHGTINAFEKAAGELFSIPGISEAIKSMVRTCEGCISMRTNPKVFKEQKPIPIPEKIGTTILIDEIHYCKPAKKGQKNVSGLWRFLFATEAITRFSNLYVINGDLTVNKLLPIIHKIKHDLCQRVLEPTTLTFRCDNSSVHASAKTQLDLQNSGIKIEIHQKTSSSKNGIAELDGRCSQISRIVRDELRKEGTTQERVAMNAAKRYNQLRGSEGFTPSELYFGTRQFTQEPFLINVKELVRRIRLCREKAREVKERMVQKGRHRNPIEISPFDIDSNHEYGVQSKSPLKEGDLVLIDKPFDKNEMHPWFRVIRGEGFGRDGIDWDHKLILTEKVGVQKHKLYTWHFTAIASILDGNNKENLEINSLRTKCRYCLNKPYLCDSVQKTKKSATVQKILGGLEQTVQIPKRFCPHTVSDGIISWEETMVPETYEEPSDSTPENIQSDIVPLTMTDASVSTLPSKIGPENSTLENVSDSTKTSKLQVIHGWFKNYLGGNRNRTDDNVSGSMSQNSTANNSTKSNRTLSNHSRSLFDTQNDVTNAIVPKFQSTPKTTIEPAQKYANPNVTQENVVPEGERRKRTRRKLFYE